MLVVAPTLPGGHAGSWPFVCVSPLERLTPAGRAGRGVTADQLFRLLPLVLILAFFFMFVIRPARARQRAVLELQSRLAPGQRVMTTAGLFATVAAVEDEVVVLETGPGVTSRWARQAIGRILDDEPGSSARGVDDPIG